MSIFTLMTLEIVALFPLLACSPESQIDPRGIYYKNNQRTEYLKILNNDFDTEIDTNYLPLHEPAPCQNMDMCFHQQIQIQGSILLASQMGLKIKVVKE